MGLGSGHYVLGAARKARENVVRTERSPGARKLLRCLFGNF
jgi:hypothetical protein